MIGIPDLPRDIIEYDVNGIDLIAPDRDLRLRMAGPTTTGYFFNRLKMGQWMPLILLTYRQPILHAI